MAVLAVEQNIFFGLTSSASVCFDMTKRPSSDEQDCVEPPTKSPCFEGNENDDPQPLSAANISTLISRIQHHPCLWDHDHESFGDRQQVDSAWRTIAEQTDVQEDHVRSLWNTVWNSCLRSGGNLIFNHLNSMASTPSTPRISPTAAKPSPMRKREVCKKVSWSRYDSVNISGHLLMLPRRFANLEIIEAGPSRTVCSGADLLTEENVIIRKTLLKDQEQTARVYHNLKWGRLLPHPNILSVLDAFEVGDSLYTVTDMMDGRLADIVDEHLNHFVIAKIVYQLLSALEPLHSNGLYHGNITLNSVFINTDAVLKLSSYGDVMQHAKDEKIKEDIISVGSILARLLLEEDSFLKLSKIKSDNDLDWRKILQGNTESGLVDFHARNILYLLLGARCSLADLLRHPYLFTFRKNVGTVPLIEAEHRDLSSLSLSDVQGLLRDELIRYESPISIQDVQ